MPKPLFFDLWLFFAAGVLCIAGVVIVGSASQYQAIGLGRDPSHFLVRQGIFAIAGLCVLLGCMKLPYDRLDDPRLVRWLVALTLAALVGVLAMPEAGGARRWYRIGSVALQPAEMAKVVAVVFLAHALAAKEALVNDLKKFLFPVGAVLGSMLLLIEIEPDLGSAVMIALTAGVLVFIAGLRWTFIAGTAAAGLVAFVAAVVAEPYRLRRIRTFLDPGSDVLGAGFQLNQSLLALGSGGWTGVGFGQSQQKAFFLPAAHTDFVFSVIGEELGLMGTSAVLAIVIVVFWRGLRAAARAPNRFGFYLALGCTSLVVLQSLIHMGVCVGLLPTKGLPLPFISYGGSSLLATMAAMGLLLNVSNHSN